MDQSAFLNLLAAAVKHKVSDVHLHPGSAPGFRISGDLMSVKHPPLTDADFRTILSTLLQGHEVAARTETLQDYDGSFDVKGLARFRYNIFRHKGHLAAILRIIPSVIPSIEELGLPKVLTRISELQRGLILVTGATGSGKSSTLAAMINHINQTSPYHILTVEDPLEFIHTPKMARISQREVGPDTKSFAQALRSALRQDPDVILVGEMRDAETIDIALKAAETGHLVLSTVHTNDAIKTIGRLVSVFPPEEQRMVRLRIADNLVASVSQRLVKRADGKGMAAAQEIMVSNAAIAECISDESRTGEINDFIMKSREISGGQTFDLHLAELFQAGVVTYEVAREASTNPSDFERNLTYGASQGGRKRPAGAVGNDESHQVVIDRPETPGASAKAESEEATESRALSQTPARPMLPPVPGVSSIKKSA